MTGYASPVTTYIEGDDAYVVLPIIDLNAGALDFTVDVRATRSDQTEATVATAAWSGPAGLTNDGTTSRNLKIPLQGLTAGLWHLRLIIGDENDLPLGEVSIVSA